MTQHPDDSGRAQQGGRRLHQVGDAQECPRHGRVSVGGNVAAVHGLLDHTAARHPDQAMMGNVPPVLSGTASGAMNTFRQIGAVLGIALAGIPSPESGGTVHSMPLTFVVGAVGAAVAALLTWIVLGRGSPRARDAGRPPAEAKSAASQSPDRQQSITS